MFSHILTALQHLSWQRYILKSAHSFIKLMMRWSYVSYAYRFISTANWWWYILKSAVSTSWWWQIIMYAYRVCKNWWWHILVYAYISYIDTTSIELMMGCSHVCLLFRHNTSISNWWSDVLMYAYCFTTQRPCWWWDVLMYAYRFTTQRPYS